MDAEGRETSGHDLGSAPKDRSLHPGGMSGLGLVVLEVLKLEKADCLFPSNLRQDPFPA